MKNWRIGVIFLILSLLGAALIVRLFCLQIIKGDYYRALSQGQQNALAPFNEERGEVFFKGGEPLATNIEGNYLFVLPGEIKEKDVMAQKLSEILKTDKESIFQKINSSASVEALKFEPTSEEEKAIKQLNLPGLYFKEGIFRRYPQQKMASQTIGFLGGEGAGQYGIEGFYDNILQTSGNGDALGKGASIFLNIDYNIQFIAENLLEKAAQDLKIESGQIIVMEPDTGKVMALASWPGFDPNRYSEVESFEIFQNPANQKFFEPGSIFKPITMAAALDQNKITPQTTFVDTGPLKIGNYTISNFNKKVWGEKTMTQVLENSINTGAVFAERSLGQDLFLDYINRFGFFEPTGIDLQGEVYWENNEFKKGYEINFATAAFGQGIGITPIQMLRAFSSIANGGRLVQPQVVGKITGTGEAEEINPEISSGQIISSKTVSQLTAMLISVVENGSGKRAKIPGYYLAGKTGTAQMPFSSLGLNQKGYSDMTWQSFVGFGPAFKPKFAILVKLDNPRSPGSEASAAPIFQEMAKYIIDYLEIPPDYE